MKWAKRLCLIASLFLPSALLAQAQVGRVTGTVTDSASTTPLADAPGLHVSRYPAPLRVTEQRPSLPKALANARPRRSLPTGKGGGGPAAVFFRKDVRTSPAAVRVTTISSSGSGNRLSGSCS